MRSSQIACLASTAFLVMRLAIDIFSRGSGLATFHAAHFTATGVFFLVWILAGGRGFSDKGSAVSLRKRDE